MDYGAGVDAAVAESGRVGEELQVRAKAREEKRFVRADASGARAFEKRRLDKPAANWRVLEPSG
jgi:hypothetical protein